MTYLPPELGFLGLPSTGEGYFPACVIPFPLENTVSWKGGTSKGPAAILEASHQVELFDETRMMEPCSGFQLLTREEPVVEGSNEAALQQLAEIVHNEVSAGRFPLILGGEHALTAGAIRPFLQTHEKLVIVQIDAHADLRDGYEGEVYSHAAAMRRCLDFPDVSLVSLGIRNISQEEIPFLEEESDRIDIFWAHQRRTWDDDRFRKLIHGKSVYLTIDLDGFDSSLMPATGTPEPGGLFWDDVIHIISTVASQSKIVGADIVELAPYAGLHACDFLAAKLGYRVLTAAMDSASG